jgi:hypothetical protein
VEARHRRRVRQAQHEAAQTVVGWAAACQVGTLAVGDPAASSTSPPGGGTTGAPATGASATSSRPWPTRPSRPGSPSSSWTSGAPPRPAPPATSASPSPPGGCSPARTVRSPATATWSRLPISPPARAAGPRQPSSRLASRTAAPGRTFRVCLRRDVTRAAALITAAPARPLAGTGPLRPPPPGTAGESLAQRRGPRKHQRTYGDVH